MKVLFLVPSKYPDGAANAKHIQRIAFGLKSNGVECEVLGFERTSSTTGVWTTDALGISNFGLPVGASRIERRLGGITTLARKIQVQVSDAIDHRQVTHVWIYSPSWLFWHYVVGVCNARHVKVISHVTEWWQMLGAAPLSTFYDQQLFFKLCWPKVDGFVGISTPLFNYAVQRKKAAVRIPVPCPVESQNRSVSQSHDAGTFNVVYSGILANRDMPDVMLGAIRRLIAANERIRFFILGDTQRISSGRRFCKIVSEDPNIKRYVKVTGFLSNTEYEDYIKAADAFWLLHEDSFESRACFPTRLSEHLLTGNPVIVSGVGDIPLYLRNGIDAMVLSQKNSIEELVDATLKLANDQALSRRIGSQGRNRALDVFSPVGLGRKIKDFLSLLNG